MAETSTDARSEGDASELNAAKAEHSLRRGLIEVGLLVAVVVGLLLAIPGLKGVADQVTDMRVGWLVVAVVLEVLSCLGYVLAFLQVFDRAPIRFGARVALSELAFGAAVSLGGAGSAAVGVWLLVDRGAEPKPVAERTAVLFLLTSAVNVITLVVAGLVLWLGLVPGKRDPLLTLLPAVVGIVTLAFFLALPSIAERRADRIRPGRVRVLLTETAITIRLTKQLLLTPDWRLIGAFGYLWFDIAVLAACFAAAGHVPPIVPLILAYQIGYISNLIPVPGNIGILDGSLVGMFVLFGVGATISTASTIVYHAIALWVPAMWGTIAFVLLQRSRGQPVRLRPPRSERRRRSRRSRSD